MQKHLEFHFDVRDQSFLSFYSAKSCVIHQKRNGPCISERIFDRDLCFLKQDLSKNVRICILSVVQQKTRLPRTFYIEAALLRKPDTGNIRYSNLSFCPSESFILCFKQNPLQQHGSNALPWIVWMDSPAGLSPVSSPPTLCLERGGPHDHASISVNSDQKYFLMSVCGALHLKGIFR